MILMSKSARAFSLIVCIAAYTRPLYAEPPREVPEWKNDFTFTYAARDTKYKGDEQGTIVQTEDHEITVSRKGKSLLVLDKVGNKHNVYVYDGKTTVQGFAEEVLFRRYRGLTLHSMPLIPVPGANLPLVKFVRQGDRNKSAPYSTGMFIWSPGSFDSVSYKQNNPVEVPTFDDGGRITWSKNGSVPVISEAGLKINGYPVQNWIFNDYQRVGGFEVPSKIVFQQSTLVRYKHRLAIENLVYAPTRKIEYKLLKFAPAGQNDTNYDVRTYLPNRVGIQDHSSGVVTAYSFDRYGGSLDEQRERQLLLDASRVNAAQNGHPENRNMGGVLGVLAVLMGLGAWATRSRLRARQEDELQASQPSDLTPEKSDEVAN